MAGDVASVSTAGPSIACVGVLAHSAWLKLQIMCQPKNILTVGPGADWHLTAVTQQHQQLSRMRFLRTETETANYSIPIHLFFSGMNVKHSLFHCMLTIIVLLAAYSVSIVSIVTIAFYKKQPLPPATPLSANSCFVSPSARLCVAYQNETMFPCLNI